jgi:heme exporter protein CcmD
MNVVSAWLAMGGYAKYVWPAYLLVFSTLAFTALHIKRQNVQTKKRVKYLLEGDKLSVGPLDKM